MPSIKLSESQTAIVGRGGHLGRGRLAFEGQNASTSYSADHLSPYRLGALRCLFHLVIYASFLAWSHHGLEAE